MSAPEATHRRGSRRIARLAALTCVAMLAVLLPVAVSAGTLNTVVLDNGTCGHNLQLGSDPTASSSATPWFLLYGDGAAASYAMSIDGVSIGTFNTSNMFGDVCINAASTLTQGTHTLTGNELAPHATYTVTPFTFSVDTVPPAVPSTPVLSPTTDSGVLGDNITTYQSVKLTGTSDSGVSIRVYDGPNAGVGGAKADSTGRWTVATIALSIATHTLTATAADQAGNVSARSGSLLLTITAATATVPGAPTLTSATAGNGQVALAWTAPTSNGGSAISGYRVYRSTTSGSEVLYATPGLVTAYIDSGVVNGTTYFYRVAAVNSVGTGGLSNELSATPVASATVPTAPSSVYAAPNKPKGISLSWSSPVSNGGSAITAYRIYRATSSGSEVLYAAVGVVTTFVDTGTSRSVSYYYRVSVVNAVGESGLSAEVTSVGR